MRVSVDVGGTFTDVIVLDEDSGALRLEKVETVPADPASGVLAGFDKARAPLQEVDFFVHGTTLGINALLTRGGARVRHRHDRRLPRRLRARPHRPGADVRLHVRHHDRHGRVDIHTIGAGGGSIAWIDDGGHLQVGPQSAGAVPGPACSGKGGEHPTFTDAALAVGYLDPGNFLGGEVTVDTALADAAIGTLAEGVGSASVIDQLAGPEDYPHLVDALARRGFSEDERDAILAGNWLRLLREALPA